MKTPDYRDYLRTGNDGELAFDVWGYYKAITAQKNEQDEPVVRDNFEVVPYLKQRGDWR